MNELVAFLTIMVIAFEFFLIRLMPDYCKDDKIKI